MEKYKQKEISNNIIMLGVDFFTTFEFEKKFNGLKEEDQKIKNLNFQKSGMKVTAKVPYGEEIDLISPITIYKDELKSLIVEYHDHERKLLIAIIDNNRMEDLKYVVKTLLQEQSSKITAIGFNFKTTYIFNVNETITFMEDDRVKLKKEVLKEKDVKIEKVDKKFVFEENNFTKTYNIDQNITPENEYSYTVKANYHYDEFKSVNSTSRIKSIIIDLIKDNYDNHIEEFKLISDRVINL